MFKIILMIVIGVIGGLIGGMGMGGGTFLIPLLTIFCGISQHGAQCINLVAFVPMSLVALYFHFKNKLIELRYALWISIPAVFLSLLFAYLAKFIDAKAMSKYFGIFLIVLGLYQLIAAIINCIDKKKKQDDFCLQEIKDEK